MTPWRYVRHNHALERTTHQLPLVGALVASLLGGRSRPRYLAEACDSSVRST